MSFSMTISPGKHPFIGPITETLNASERNSRRRGMDMKRDFALRIDSLLVGVRSSLSMLVEYIRDHIPNGTFLMRNSKSTFTLSARACTARSSFRTNSIGSFPTSRLMR